MPDTHTTSAHTTSAHTGANKGSDAVNDLKSGVKGIHGMGEAIRGNFNEAVDSTFHDKVGETKNRNIADRGIDDMERADRTLGQKHGVNK